MAKSFSRPRVLPKRGGLRLSDQQRKAATIWYNWYAGGGARAIFVSLAGSGDGSGSGEDNSMSFATWKTQFQAGTLSGTFYFKKGEVYDFSDFDVPEPSIQTSELSVVGIQSTRHNLFCNRGNGDFILVVSRKNAAPIFTPTNNTIYTKGDDLGNDTVVSFVGAGRWLPLFDLVPDTEYYHTAFEFNTNDIEIKYKVDGAPTVSASTFTSEFQAGLDLAATEGWKVPTLDQQIAENISLKDAITKGFFAQAPRFYNFYSKHTDPNWRGINWKSPSISTQALFVAGITHNAEGGVTGNGTTGYINFQWNPSTQGGGLVSATDMAVATNIRNYVSGSPIYGIFGSNSFELRTGASVTGRLNTAAGTGAILVNTSPIVHRNGLWIAEVRALNTGYISVDDTVIFNGSSTGLGAGVPNANFVGLARNNESLNPDTVDTFFGATMDFFIPYKATTVDREDIKAWWAAHKARIDAL